MAEVLLFHHIQGLTAGVRAFADQLRAGGHTVHTPDLFDGHTFETLTDRCKRVAAPAAVCCGGAAVSAAVFRCYAAVITAEFRASDAE